MGRHRLEDSITTREAHAMFRRAWRLIHAGAVDQFRTHRPPPFREATHRASGHGYGRSWPSTAPIPVVGDIDLTRTSYGSDLTRAECTG